MDKHYKFIYRGIRIDPNFVCKLWGVTDLPLMTVIKKICRNGNGGHKDQVQDIRECINALQHQLALIESFKPTEKNKKDK